MVYEEFSLLSNLVIADISYFLCAILGELRCHGGVMV